MALSREQRGGEGWIRTSVRKPGQIYSLLPLTTRPPLHEARRSLKGCGRSVNAGQGHGCANRRPGSTCAHISFSTLRSRPLPKYSSFWISNRAAEDTVVENRVAIVEPPLLDARLLRRGKNQVDRTATSVGLSRLRSRTTY